MLSESADFLPAGLPAEVVAEAIISTLEESDRGAVGGASGLVLEEADIARLGTIPFGTRGAAEYHRFIFRVLSVVFEWSLVDGTIEIEQFDGRGRIDIVHRNAAAFGFFAELSPRFGIEARYVPSECKNYSAELTNSEFNQLAQRLNDDVGHFGFLVCRRIRDRRRMLRRCVDRKRKGDYIVTLDDADVRSLIEMTLREDEEGKEAFLHRRLRELLFEGTNPDARR